MVQHMVVNFFSDVVTFEFYREMLTLQRGFAIELLTCSVRTVYQHYDSDLGIFGDQIRGKETVTPHDVLFFARGISLHISIEALKIPISAVSVTKLSSKCGC